MPSDAANLRVLRELRGGFLPECRRARPSAPARVAHCRHPRDRVVRSRVIAEIQGPGPSDRRARRRPALAHDARREDRADAGHLAAEDQDSRRGGTLRSDARPGGSGTRPWRVFAAQRNREHTKRAAAAHGTRGSGVRQRGPEVGGRTHAAGHSRDVSRRGAARIRRAARDVVPGANRAREQLGSVARRARDECGGVRSARARLRPRARASHRSGPRPEMGTIRGDIRRGSLSGLAPRRGRDPRVSGHEPAVRAAQRARDTQALRRPRLARSWRERGAQPRAGAAAAFRVARAVRGRRQRNESVCGHAQLQRDRWRAVTREPVAARGRPAPRMGIPRNGRLGLLRDPGAREPAESRGRPRRRQRPGARRWRGPRAA